MHDQPRYEPYEGSEFFADGRSMRPRIAGTVARGQLREDTAYFAGKTGEAFVDRVPVPVDMELLQRGRERYGIYCTPCHGQLGRGDGTIVRRGYRQPETFHQSRLRVQPAGYFYDVITNGFGVMPDYAGQIAVRDRWAIVAYVWALQISQNATLADVPPERRSELDQVAPPPAAEGHHP